MKKQTDTADKNRTAKGTFFSEHDFEMARSLGEWDEGIRPPELTKQVEELLEKLGEKNPKVTGGTESPAP